MRVGSERKHDFGFDEVIDQESQSPIKTLKSRADFIGTKCVNPAGLVFGVGIRAVMRL